MEENKFQEVLDFISNFNQAPCVEEMFMGGGCFWFANILKQRFHERGYIVEFYHDAVEGHFLAAFLKQNESYWDDKYTLFDIRGDVTDQYNIDDLDNLWQLSKDDPNYYLRLMRDCYDIVPSQHETSMWWYPA